MSAVDPPANASDAPIPTTTRIVAPAVFTTAVLVARIALVVSTCVLIAVLPYLFTAEDTQIVSYKAPKESPRQLPAAQPSAEGAPGRLWGAVLPRERELWFFKLTGPIEEVTRLENSLNDFLQTVRFQGDRPTWSLPKDWKQQPGNEFRFATIVIPAAKPLELTVSKLPRGDEPLAEQLLANINRWRGQVAQPPVTLDELPDATERIEIDGVEATVMALTGTIQPSGMGRPPFAGRN